MSELIKPWRRTHTKILADLRILKVQEVTAVSPKTGQEHGFFVLDTVDWVNVLPITDNDEVVFVRQYRHGSDALSLEIPGGMVDPGEVPDIAAARECLEESGFLAEGLTSLGVLNPNPAVFNNRLHTFVAQGVRPSAAIQNTPTEQTEVVLIPVAELSDMLLDGRIDHALVAATLWRYLYLNR
ncbi:MAG: NUDIX hydrolase [Pseudomonadales bacterium]|nr:NUDIX hydrolase [Pseudomonadales bacterium]